MRIDSAGNGIGTDSPTELLTVGESVSDLTPGGSTKYVYISTRWKCVQYCILEQRIDDSTKNGNNSRRTTLVHI